MFVCFFFHWNWAPLTTTAFLTHNPIHHYYHNHHHHNLTPGAGILAFKMFFHWINTSKVFTWRLTQREITKVKKNSKIGQLFSGVRVWEDRQWGEGLKDDTSIWKRFERWIRIINHLVSKPDHTHTKQKVTTYQNNNTPLLCRPLTFS